MSTSISKLSYETLDGLGYEHACWLERYLNEAGGDKYTLHEESLMEAVDKAHEDERLFASMPGHVIQVGHGIRYTVNPETTKTMEKVLAAILEKEGCVDLEVNW